LLVAQRLEHSFLSSLQEKGQLLFRIISVRYSLRQSDEGVHVLLRHARVGSAL
jgi:hypothetical protein